MIYLDNAATTLIKPESVGSAMMKALKNCANAGRGGYNEAFMAAECIYKARERVCELFGARSPEQVVFTSNATHSLNVAIKGVLANGGHCVISGYEHNSVLRPIESLRRINVSYSVARGRLFDCEDMIRKFKNSLKKNTEVAVITHISNVFGYILPIKEIDEICKIKGIPLIIDASQSAGSADVKLSDLRATVCICAPGHKGLYGPQGTGILVCRDGEKLGTLLEGGTGSVSVDWKQPNFMPDRLESGTMNLPGIAGLSEGVSYVLARGTENIMQKERSLIELLVDEMKKMEGVFVFAAKERNLQGGVVSFLSDRVSPEYISERLGEAGIAVRSGLQCSPTAHQTVGTRLGTVRVSVSDFTDEEDINCFLSCVKDILHEV